jgi:uncharacterized protein DUF4242
MATILVEERFDPPVDPSKGNPEAGKLSPCLPVEGVTWVSSFIAQDGARCVCLYDAPDAESVRRAYRKAGAAFEAAWPAVALKPG